MIVFAAATDVVLGGAITSIIGAVGAWVLRRAPKTRPETAIDEGTALVQRETARAREVERWGTLMDELGQDRERLRSEMEAMRSELEQTRVELDQERTMRRRSDDEIRKLRIELSSVRAALDAKR